VAAEPPGGVFRATDKPTPPLISIIPGAARGDSKRWPHFAEAGRLLAAAIPDLRFAILGTKAEDGLCQQVADAIGADRAVNAAGRTSLPEFAALLAASSAVLCNDSGGMHLAAAVGTPVVAVFGLTDWRRTGPLGRMSVVVRQQGVEGRRAIARHSAAAAAVLNSIPPGRVAAAAGWLLRNHPKPVG
jgi:ADP-heptose:LPS heptosyltransferase